MTHESALALRTRSLLPAALLLREEGRTYREIAALLGFRSPTRAHQLVKQARVERDRDGIAALRRRAGGRQGWWREQVIGVDANGGVVLRCPAGEGGGR